MEVVETAGVLLLVAIGDVAAQQKCQSFGSTQLPAQGGFEARADATGLTDFSFTYVSGTTGQRLIAARRQSILQRQRNTSAAQLAAKGAARCSCEVQE